MAGIKEKQKHPTHAELIKRAFTWLKNQKRCTIIASELVTGGLETPDVIGWDGWVSWLVEAKISVADFRADRRKIFRTLAGRGMGVHRYYIVPSDLVDILLPILPDGWGLLSYGVHRKLVVERTSAVFQPNWQNEILYLSSIIRRIAMREEPLKGINVRCYTYQVETQPKAELYVDQSEIPEEEKRSFS